MNVHKGLRVEEITNQERIIPHHVWICHFSNTTQTSPTCEFQSMFIWSIVVRFLSFSFVVRKRWQRTSDVRTEHFVDVEWSIPPWSWFIPPWSMLFRIQPGRYATTGPSPILEGCNVSGSYLSDLITVKRCLEQQPERLHEWSEWSDRYITSPRLKPKSGCNFAQWVRSIGQKLNFEIPENSHAEVPRGFDIARQYR